MMVELSTHKAEIIKVTLRNHPNAERLQICDAHGGFPCCVASGQFHDGDLACYIPPDSLVDTSRPEFAFLAKPEKSQHRVRCVKLRGVQSFGLLVPCPPGMSLGDDAAEFYGVGHYEPPMQYGHGGDVQRGPSREAENPPDELAHLTKYDVDSLRRYRYLFVPGEPVYCSEKIHGANSRFCYLNDRMYCGSRSEWKRQSDTNLWWAALSQTPAIESFCRSQPGVVLYGEVYGQVSNLKYGTKQGEFLFAAFDILNPDGRFLGPEIFRNTCQFYSIPMVPLLGMGIPFDFDVICAMADGPSLCHGANHTREGVVCKPMQERCDQRIGRVMLKCVGAVYLGKE